MSDGYPLLAAWQEAIFSTPERLPSQMASRLPHSYGTVAASYAFLQIPANGQPPNGVGSMSGCFEAPWDNTNSKEQIANLSLLSTGALAFVGIGQNTNASNVGVGVGRYPQPQSSCDLDPNYGKNGVWYSTEWQFWGDVLFETDGSVDLFAGKTDTSALSLVHIDSTGKLTAPVTLPFVCSFCNDSEKL
jgi:hypothetical protein